MAKTYKPTEAEITAFRRDLRKYVALAEEEDGGGFTANDLRALAQHHWPDRNVRVKSDLMAVDWIDSYPDVAGDKPKTPTAAPVAPVAEVEQVTPSTGPAPSHGRPLPAGVEQARRDFQNIYGGHEGVKVITVAPDYDDSSRVFDARGNVKDGGQVVDGLNEQDRRELAALPAYGEPGGEKSLKRSREIRQRAAIRTAQQALTGPPLPPAPPSGSGRAFIDEVERRQASGDPMQVITSHAQLAEVAARHGVDAATFGRHR
jgi:hypothetical protein